ncbi:MAG: riboflavin biosynthesis protein RibF [Candidatus Coproplasma sp.]
MLKVVEYAKDEYEFPALLVLGCFDAIHAGHRELLKKAKLQAKINGLDLGVMVFKGGKSDKLLYSFEERLQALEQIGVKFVLAVDFNNEFKSIKPIDFLKSVEEKVNVKAYMSGKDFRFGAGAKGKASTLKSYAEDEENGVWYQSVKDIDIDGEKVSTTLIKTCLDSGDTAKASLLLGGDYSVTGEVVKGAGRGASVVGFPTVNIEYPDWKYPVKYGVYNVNCDIGGTIYQGIANFGTCPTFEDERIALEVYIKDFSGDLYGQTLTVYFVSYIRDIQQFGSAEELSAQLSADATAVEDSVESKTDSEEECKEENCD